jgi:hypothetical protein
MGPMIKKKDINKSFEYDVEGYDLKTKEYVLRNKVTAAEKRIDKEYYEQLVREQLEKRTEK